MCVCLLGCNQRRSGDGIRVINLRCKAVGAPLCLRLCWVHTDPPRTTSVAHFVEPPRQIQGPKPQRAQQLLNVDVAGLYIQFVQVRSTAGCGQKRVTVQVCQALYPWCATTTNTSVQNKFCSNFLEWLPWRQAPASQHAAAVSAQHLMILGECCRTSKLRGKCLGGKDGAVCPMSRLAPTVGARFSQTM
jgi:hypothetical protein